MRNQQASHNRVRKGVPSFYEALQESVDRKLMEQSVVDDQDRLIHSIEEYKGYAVTVTLNNQSSYDGYLESVDPVDFSVSIKMAKRQMNILGKDIAILELKEKPRSGFQIDTAISKTTSPPKHRELEKWVPDDDGSQVDLQLSKPGTTWDQFKVNETKFGVTTDFNEEMYTTVLDKSGPDFKKKEARAAQLAREIESQPTANVHLLEERGKVTAGENEEEKYSSVIRENHRTETASQSGSKTPLNTTKQTAKFSEAIKSLPAKVKLAPEVASAIRKNSIDLLVQNPKTASSHYPATSPQVRPNIEELTKSFKPFAKDLKAHLLNRHNQIASLERKGVIADFKKFSADFQLPASLAKKPESKPSSQPATATSAKPTSVQTNVEPIIEKKQSLSATQPSPPSPTKQPETMSAVTERPKAWPKKPTTNTQPKKPATKPTKKDDSSSVVSDADSHVTSGTNATSATATTASKFKLSVNAPEFTPGAGFVSEAIPMVPVIPGYMPYPEGYYPPDPNMYYNQFNGYRPMMPRGYPQMAIPMPAGQYGGHYFPNGFVPPVYPVQPTADGRPPPFPPAAPVYMMMPTPNQPWYEEVPDEMPQQEEEKDSE